MRTCKLALQVATALALAACAATPEPAIEIRTVEVPVIEQRPCPAIVPTRPEPLARLPDDANAALAQVLGKLAEYSGAGMFADRAQDYFSLCSRGE